MNISEGVRELVTKADSMLSYLHHRGYIRYEAMYSPTQSEVEKLIADLRKAATLEAPAAPAEAEKRGEPSLREIIDFVRSLGTAEEAAVADILEQVFVLSKAGDEHQYLFHLEAALEAKRAAPAPESQRPEPWNPEIESFDVALQRQHDYNAKLAKRISEATEKEGSNG